MGQYWLVVNLDKKEYIYPHKLGAGLKLWEQLANHPGTGAALIVLCAAMPERRGGGDFDLQENWHGPERTLPEHNITPGPMPSSYEEIAMQTIGRWAGDRIALVGDYAEDSDLPAEFRASHIYWLCHISSKEELTEFNKKCEEHDEPVFTEQDIYTDVSGLVAKVIEHELQGEFIGSGWREFHRGGN